MNEVHNPRNLPSAGEPPYRFILVSELEKLPKDAEVWDNLKKDWVKSYSAGRKADFWMFTYRTKEALPV